MSYPPADNIPPQQPGAPGYAPQPGYFPPAPAPAKKGKTKLVLGVTAGVLGLCCVGGTIAAAVGGGGAPETTTADTEVAADNAAAAVEPTATKKVAAPKKTEAEKPKVAGIGDPVRDGKFEFTVTKLDCSKTEVGNSFLSEKAQGKFCLISVTVKNIGKEAQYFDGSSQKAMDAEGIEFSNDGAAEIYANEDSATFLNEINPGNGVKGKLIFDVPKSTKLTTIELHDSPFSGGVEVALS